MNTTYTSLFRVTLAHSYFASGICDCLNYKASVDTQILMNTYGLIQKATTNGFEVYATTSQPIETFLNYITKVSETTAFEFAGITSNETFYNFTALPVNQLGVLTYQSDNQENVVTAENIQLAETFVSDETSQEAISIIIIFRRAYYPTFLHNFY